MLLDTDMTITNSPDASPSQVHYTIKRKENKIMMLQDSGNVQQQQQYHHHHHHHEYYLHEQQNRSTKLRSIHNLNPISQINSIPLNFSCAEKQFNRKIQRSSSTITSMQTGRHSSLGKVNKELPLQSQFNPYADENDNSSRFQLSKSISNRCNIGISSFGADASTDTTNIFNRSRLFGTDRTNLMQIDRIPFSNRSPNVINLRKENFHTFNITNNMILKNSNYMNPGNHEFSQSSQLIKENPVMFRNYDLNDEYWLNFE